MSDKKKHKVDELLTAGVVTIEDLKGSESSRAMARRLTASGHSIGKTALADYRLKRGWGISRKELDKAKILVFDIETIPAQVTTYDLKPNWIPHKNVVTHGDMLCWSAGWYHEPGKTLFMDRHTFGYEEMLQGLWDLLDEAAYVVGWNSDRFDLTKCRGYFARAGFPPFRPPKSIDLMKTARTFGFESASLDYTARMFGTTRKVGNGAVANWKAVLDGDPKAIRQMRKYNRGDILATTELFDAMRPWITNHPAIGGESTTSERCPRCGSTDLNYVGVSQAVVVRYSMFRCANCKGLCRHTVAGRASRAKGI